MAYTKIVQYGDIVELYQYENSRIEPKFHIRSSAQKKRAQERFKRLKELGKYKRKYSSIRRSQMAFFRLVHHNNIHATNINFLTLTFAYDVTFKKASRHVSETFRKLKENLPEVSLSYISVPERTKKGRLHFHLLVYNLPPEICKRERETRNLQRLFERGYIDIRPVSKVTEGIAGYMAKYMAKNLEGKDNEFGRGYTTSRNIKKIASKSSNTLDQYLDMIIPDGDVLQRTTYKVPYLGRCNYKKIKNNIYADSKIYKKDSRYFSKR